MVKEAAVAAVFDWERLISVISTGGVTGAGLFLLLIVMLATGRLWTGTAHREVVDAMEKSHQRALDAVHASYKIAVDTLENRNQELRSDNQLLGEAVKLERDRGDDLQVKVSEEVIPLITITNQLLTALRSEGGKKDG